MLSSHRTNSKVLDQHISSLKKLNDLPKEINVSTITITCKINTEFNIINIGKYIKLSEGSIYSVKYKYCDNENCIRSLIKKKPKKSKKKKKKKRLFYNQATLEICKENSNKFVNVKLFKNGSIHMTGCRNYNDFDRTLRILCRELNRTMAIIVHTKTKKQIIKNIVLKEFVKNKENIDINKVERFNINMINTNFKIGYKIDRTILYELLKSMNIECMYEPNVHACVNIKHNYKNEATISIFVFESGSIIITAAKKKEHIDSAYKFIMDILNKNKQKIHKYDVQSFLKGIDISKLKGIDISKL